MRDIKQIMPLLLLAALALIALPALAEQAEESVAASTSAPASELDRMQDLYRAITGYHVLLDQESVSSDMVKSVLHDVERYVDELENRLSTEKLFVSDQRQVYELSEWVAKAHFQAALMHAKGVDLESSIDQFERVIELLGYHPMQWDTEIERSAHRGQLQLVGDVVYEMAQPREIVRDLQRFWSAGVMTRFEVGEFPTSTLDSFTIERVDVSLDAFDAAAFDLARQRFAERVSGGERELRVVLPPGTYEVRSSEGVMPTRRIVVEEGSSPDPVMLGPRTFSFQFATASDNCRPTLQLSGVALSSLEDLPFGTFTVIAPETCDRRIPNKIIVSEGDEVRLRTEPEKLDYLREGQPIFVYITTPADSVYTLRM
jgi:hypothetical protein